MPSATLAVMSAPLLSAGSRIRPAVSRPACISLQRARWDAPQSRSSPRVRPASRERRGVPAGAGAGPVTLASGRRQKGTLDHCFAPGAPGVPTSELRAAIDADGIAGDPPGIFGCQEGDNTTDVVGLRNALERLHPKDELAARVCLGEVRHVRLDDTGRDGIDADTACAKHRGEMLHQGVDGALGCCICRAVPTTARAASDETKTMLLPF